jgi:anti-sigma factor RsiW
MSTCTSIDPLVTQYVDGELSPDARTIVDEHLRHCPPCHSRVAAESAARDLVHSRKPDLTAERAPAALRARCSAAASRGSVAPPQGASPPGARSAAGRRGWLPRTVSRMGLAPFALAASLVALVGAAFLYQATHYSARLLAAELAADHMKCFAASSLLGTHDEPAAVESSMMSAFGWRLHLPEQFDASGYQLVGSRRCLYAEGRVAHLMYRDDRGRPVSIFMLPKRTRPEELVEALGHEAAIWSSGDRTFVLVARGSRADVQRMASFVKAALQ